MEFSFLAFTSSPSPLWGVGEVVFRAPIRLGGRGRGLGGLEDISFYFLSGWYAREIVIDEAEGVAF